LAVVTNGELTNPRRRIPLAVAAAAAAACATSLLSGLIYSITLIGSPSDFLDPSFYGVSFYVGAVAATVAAVACPILFVLVGLPLHALAVRRKWTSVWAYTVVGLAVSCVAASAALFVFPFDAAIAVPLTAVGGCVAAVVFWMVARPDKRIS
jgi:hypothetical protein